MTWLSEDTTKGQASGMGKMEEDTPQRRALAREEA